MTAFPGSTGLLLGSRPGGEFGTTMVTMAARRGTGALR